MIRLDGKKYGRWTAIRPEKNRYRHGESVKWVCRCICGTKKAVNGFSLRNGISKSCGCLSKEITAKRNRENATHGKSKSNLYKVWIGIKQRCYYKNMKQYKYYGGRGIFVCNEWLYNFENFHEWAMKNGWTPDLEVDRIDNNKGYSPENCRCVSGEVNARNKSTSKYWFIHGVRYETAKEASLALGVTTTKIQYMCLGRKASKHRKPKKPLDGCFAIKKYQLDEVEKKVRGKK